MPSESLTYDSARARLPMLEDAIELFRYRSLLMSLVQRDLTVRYKRSALGFVWTMLNPLLTMLVLTVVFSNFFVFPLEHYAVFILSGLILWNFFSQSTTQAMHSLVWGGGLINKIYVPKSVFIAAAIVGGAVNLLFALAPLALIMLVSGHPFTPALLFLPISILLTFLFALGIALFVSTLAVFFVDLVEIYQVGLMILMYLTPIIYPLAVVPPTYLPFLQLNPMYYFVELFREPVYQGIIPEPAVLVRAVVLAVGSFVIGWWYLVRKADEFAYRV